MSLFPIENIRTCCKCGKRFIHTGNTVELDLGDSNCDDCTVYLDYEFTTNTTNKELGVILSHKTEGEDNDD